MSISPPLNVEVMNIFFDESGKNSDRPCIMGGLLIPKSVYNSLELNDLNKKLTSGEMKLHWTDYTGDARLKNNIKETIEAFSKIARYSKMNVINYNRSSLDNKYKHLEEQSSNKPEKRKKKGVLNYATLMVYTKIPERIFYGLLRHFGKDVNIKTDIYIEKEGNYEKYNLETRLIENLNTQSLYRAEQFWVQKCTMLEKGQMIGIELVDLLLGMIRFIIKNPPIPLGLSIKEYEEAGLKGTYMKSMLIIELLKNPLFYDFISNIKYYEWDSHKELSEVSFKDYLNLFMAKHFREF